MAYKDGNELVAKNLLVYAADKGTQDVDREKINKIIMEMSGDSAFHREKREHRDQGQAWIATARTKLATFDATQRSVARHHLAKAAARLEGRRSELDAAGTCCAVVDFDMFYAAVEIRDRPELKDKPVAVGGIGMISTANYVARRWGVRSAMPGFIGQALCRRGPEFGMPKTELVFVRPDFQKYERVAGIARAIFAQYDPHFRAYSSDEAYIDLTRYLRCRVASITRSMADNMNAQMEADVGDEPQACKTRQGGDHASASALLADAALEAGALKLQEAQAATRDVAELRGRLDALRAGDEVIDDDAVALSREEQIAEVEAALDRARSRVDDAAGAFDELRACGIDVSSGDMDVVARLVKARLAEISAAVDALPALDFIRDEEAGALAEQVLGELRAAVRDATDGLTLSGGLGPNFRLAKVAADQKKPDGQFRVGAGKAAVLEFLRDLPCRKIGGIGRVLEMKLHDALNVRTCGDLVDCLPECYCVLGKSAAMGFLQEVALGCGEAGGPTDDGEEEDVGVIRRKGLGNERTFRPVRGAAALTEKLVQIAGLVSERLVNHDMRAAKWTLKLKTTDFRISTRDTAMQKTGKDRYVCSVAAIVALLKPLLLEAIGEAEASGTPLEIRLMGVRSSEFEGQYVPLAPGQTTLNDLKFKTASPPRPKAPPAASGQASLDDVKFKPASPSRPRAAAPPAPTSPVSPGTTAAATASTGIDGADVDPATLSELPPAVRADIERQLNLWRKSRRSAPAPAAPARRPPPKKPRTLDNFLAAPAPSPPPPPAPQADEAPVAQITSMGFSRKSALAALQQANGDVSRALERLLS